MGNSATSGPENLPVPRHVAIIMDGNGRWAARKGLPRIEGHRRGVNNARGAVGTAMGLGVEHLTLYAFSTENWNRPAGEVRALFAIMAEIMEKAIDFALSNNVRFQALGDVAALPARLRDVIARAGGATRDCTGITVSVCLNYGSRAELVNAVRRIVALGVPPDEVDERLLGEHLYTFNVPDPDLIIRTGGEQRLSNFLLWQAAYAELYFTDVLWPDFGEAELREAIKAYGQRQRRFGAVAGATR